MRLRPYRGPLRRLWVGPAFAPDDSAPAAVDHPYAPSGGLVFGGAVAVSFAAVVVASGGLVFGGAAAVAKAVTPAPSGGLQLGGAAAVSFTRVVEPSGGLVFGGAADVSKARTAAAPSGGLVFGGAAQTGLGHAYFAPAPDGGLAFGGAAEAFYQVSSLQPPGRAIGRAAWSVGRYPWRYKPAPQPEFTPGKSYAYTAGVQLGPFVGSAECHWKIQPVDFIGAAHAMLQAFGGNAVASFYSAARKRREESELLQRLW